MDTNMIQQPPFHPPPPSYGFLMDFWMANNHTNIPPHELKQYMDTILFGINKITEQNAMIQEQYANIIKLLKDQQSVKVEEKVNNVVNEEPIVNQQVDVNQSVVNQPIIRGDHVLDNDGHIIGDVDSNQNIINIKTVEETDINNDNEESKTEDVKNENETTNEEKPIIQSSRGSFRKALLSSVDNNSTTNDEVKKEETKDESSNEVVVDPKFAEFRKKAKKYNVLECLIRCYEVMENKGCAPGQTTTEEKIPEDCKKIYKNYILHFFNLYNLYTKGLNDDTTVIYVDKSSNKPITPKMLKKELFDGPFFDCVQGKDGRKIYSLTSHSIEYFKDLYSTFGDEEYSYDIYFDLLGDYHNYLYQNKDGYAKKH